MKKQIMALFALAVAQMGLAQEETSATLYGYVRGEFAFDSRQVIAAREGNYIDLATPINRETVNGKDLNGLANFNGWGIESRLGVKITGPEFFGMKSDAVIEGHFFGNNGQTNNFGLRHAYVKLSSDKVEWMVGQFWHPMFVTNVSPRTYNFNAGSPFQPFNRSPQIRFSTKGDMFRFTAAAITERDFTSMTLGTATTSTNAAKSGLPAFHAQFQFGSDDKVVGGVGINYKTVKAAWRNVNNLDERKNVGAFNFLAYAKAQFTENFAWQIYGNYGENSTELLQLGGTAVTYNPTNNKYKVQNSRNLALWTEFFGNFSPSFEWGLFGGYSKDFGYNRKDNYYFTNAMSQAYGQDLMTYQLANNSVMGPNGALPISTWRISPRFGWKSGNTKLALEFDYTSTTWAGFETDAVQGFATGKLKKLAKDATGDNLRVSLSLIQSF